RIFLPGGGLPSLPLSPPATGRKPRLHLRSRDKRVFRRRGQPGGRWIAFREAQDHEERSEEHTSELQSLAYLVCRLLLEKKQLSAAARYASLLPLGDLLSNTGSARRGTIVSGSGAGREGSVACAVPAQGLSGSTM